MLFKIRLYPARVRSSADDSDLIAIANAYKIGELMKMAITAYANGKPVKFFSKRPLVYQNIDKTVVTVSFSINEKSNARAVELLNSLEEGKRNSFIKALFRNSFITDYSYYFNDSTNNFGNYGFNETALLCDSGYALIDCEDVASKAVKKDKKSALSFLSKASKTIAYNSFEPSIVIPEVKLELDVPVNTDIPKKPTRPKANKTEVNTIINDIVTENVDNSIKDETEEVVTSSPEEDFMDMFAALAG